MRVPLYTPTVQVYPETVGFGGVINVRIFGSKLAGYRFMGAQVGPDGRWQVRLDPLTIVGSEAASISVGEGDVLPLGPMPAVDVRFVQITPTKLTLEGVGIHDLVNQD